MNPDCFNWALMRKWCRDINWTDIFKPHAALRRAIISLTYITVRSVHKSSIICCIHASTLVLHKKENGYSSTNCLKPHCGTSLEWVRFWCLARSEALEKALLQPSCSHTYGFSPVCERRWVFRFSRREYALAHPSNCRKRVGFKSKIRRRTRLNISLTKNI